MHDDDIYLNRWLHQSLFKNSICVLLLTFRYFLFVYTKNDWNRSQHGSYKIYFPCAMNVTKIWTVQKCMRIKHSLDTFLPIILYKGTGGRGCLPCKLPNKCVNTIYLCADTYGCIYMDVSMIHTNIIVAVCGCIYDQYSCICILTYYFL